MLTLLRYKYLASRRNKLEPLVVWTFVVGLLALFILVSFVACVALFHGRRFPAELLAFGLLSAGILILDFNAGRQSPLNPSFAQELEYFATLPLSTMSVVTVQLMGWVFTNVMLMGIILFGPVAALIVDNSLPFSPNFLFFCALLTYGSLLLFAGAWLHLLSLRRHSWVIVPIRLAITILMPMSLILLPLPGPFRMLAAFRPHVLQLAALPLWPSAWTVLVMRGQPLAWVPLLALTIGLAWLTFPRLSRYWEQVVLPVSRRSFYPARLFNGTGWAVAKFLGLDIFTAPALRFVPQLLSLVLLPFLFWYILHPSAQVLWLISLVFTTQRVGPPLYRYLIDASDQITAAALPVTSREILRGLCIAIYLAYLPTLLPTVSIIGFTALTPGFVPGLLLGAFGIGVLAFCAQQRVTPFWAFLITGGIELVASFLI